MDHSYKMKYKNVELRQLEKTDLEYLRQWRNNPDNTKYLSSIGYITEEMQQSWYQKYLIDKDEIIFAIIENDFINNIVGSISLYNFRNNVAELGRILVGDPKAHGRGVCENALRAILVFAFEQINLDEIYLHVYEENTIALHVYEKVGFSIKGKHVKNNKIEYLMNIIRDKNSFDR